MILVAGCSDSKDNVDAGREVLTLDCATYCNTITANCTGANAQYADMNHCLGTCNGFPKGQASTETTGNTLGCRIYHAQNAMVLNDPATHCPHAGPAGDKITGTGVCGDPCLSFCTADTKICGTDATPVTGVTHRFATLQDCMTSCGNFEKTTLYAGAGVTGDNLACRVYHLTNAGSFAQQSMAASVDTHCAHTLAVSATCKAP